MQPSAMQEARLCLKRFSPMPKAEGYGTLCTSIARLYQQQESAAGNLLALQQESTRAHASQATLEQRVATLEQENDALEQQNRELEIRLEKLQLHEKQLQTASAKQFREGIAARDGEWRRIIRRLVAEK